MIATHRHRQPHRLPGLFRLSAFAFVVALALPHAGGAQQPGAKPKKLYCWDDGGRRVCSDSLPASAVGHQRTEFDPKTGMAVNRVGRALNEAERAQAAKDEEARKAEEDRARREMAMVVSYQTEADLERAFRNRFELIEESLKGSAMAQTNLHRSLISLLRQANELELQSKPVGRVLREKIRTQHAELLALRTLQQRQEAERAALDAEFREALSRYRALKNPETAGTATATATAPAPPSGG
jgi:sRNA-binding protein